MKANISLLGSLALAGLALVGCQKPAEKTAATTGQAAWQLPSLVPQRPRRLWQVPANNLTKRLGSVKNWVKSHSVFCFFDGF